MKLYRYEVFVDVGAEVMLRFATLERAEAAAAMAERILPESEVAINDMEAQTTIMSNAGMETPLYASQT